MSDVSEILHATTIAVDGRAALILGPSGAGKSALALQLIALGAALVADDRTIVRRNGRQITTAAPPAIAGRIEARGVGLLEVDSCEASPLGLVIDLSRVEESRLPEPHHHEVLGLSFPCLHKVDSVHFPSAVLLYMKKTMVHGI